MLKDAINSISDVVVERVTSPLAGAFAICWTFVNWKILLVIFFSELDVLERIAYVEKNYFSINDLFLSPLLFTLLILLIYPLASLGAVALWEWLKPAKKKLRDKFDNKLPISEDDKRKLMNLFSDLEKKHYEKLEKKDAQISYLENIVETYSKTASVERQKTAEQQEAVEQEKADLEKRVAEMKAVFEQEKIALERRVAEMKEADEQRRVEEHKRALEQQKAVEQQRAMMERQIAELKESIERQRVNSKPKNFEKEKSYELVDGKLRINGLTEGDSNVCLEILKKLGTSSTEWVNAKFLTVNFKLNLNKYKLLIERLSSTALIQISNDEISLTSKGRNFLYENKMI